MTGPSPLPLRHPLPVTILLRAEGLAVLIVALVAYWQLGGNWWLFALLILAPDLAALGYFGGPRLGAGFYNAVHNYALPLMVGLGSYFAAPNLLPFVAIWIAHIGGDRLPGYGLKYPDSFGQSHLGPIGNAKKLGG
jgi:hypothetical protein